MAPPLPNGGDPVLAPGEVFSPGSALGARLPEIVLPDQCGRLVDLHAHRDGRRALVLFHRSAGWWGFCRTQLGELQEYLPVLDRHRVEAYAISYDPVELLAQFARAYGVTYPLLSDGDSRVIQRLGLLNTLIPPGHPWHGVPYPGTLLLDGGGRVVAKSFYAAHGIRDSIARLLETGFGIAPEAPGTTRPAQTVSRAGLVATATLSAGTMRPGQVHTFTLTLAPVPGQGTAAAALPAAPGAVELAFQPVEGVVFGPVEAVPAGSGLALRASVTAARRREDFVLDVSAHLHSDGRPSASSPSTLSFRLPVRYLPNVTPVVAPEP